MSPTLTLKHPLTLTQEGGGGDIFGGNLPVTDNSMSLLRMLINKKAKENSVSIETVQKTSLETTGKTEPSLNFPTQKKSNNIQKFHSSDL